MNIGHKCLRVGVLKLISNPTCLISIFKTRTTRALSSALKVTEKLLRAQSRGQTYEHRLEAICLQSKPYVIDLS